LWINPDVPLENIQILQEYWFQATGQTLSWYFPTRKLMDMIRRTIPELKSNPEQYLCVFPFAGSALSTYMMEQMFHVETHSSERKENSSVKDVAKALGVDVVYKDSYEAVLELKTNKKIILFYFFPPPNGNSLRAWGELSKEEKTKVPWGLSAFENRNSTDLKILDHLANKGNLCWVIFNGCESFSGSRGLHSYMNNRFDLVHKSYTRASNDHRMIQEGFQVFEYDPDIFEFSREKDFKEFDSRPQFRIKKLSLHTIHE
jgi:hypothetical protein